MKIEVQSASRPLLPPLAFPSHSAHTWLFMKGQLKGDIMALCYNRGRLRPSLSENERSCCAENDHA